VASFGSLAWFITKLIVDGIFVELASTTGVIIGVVSAIVATPSSTTVSTAARLKGIVLTSRKIFRTIAKKGCCIAGSDYGLSNQQ